MNNLLTKNIKSLVGVSVLGLGSGYLLFKNNQSSGNTTPMQQDAESRLKREEFKKYEEYKYPKKPTLVYSEPYFKQHYNEIIKKSGCQHSNLPDIIAGTYMGDKPEAQAQQYFLCKYYEPYLTHDPKSMEVYYKKAGECLDNHEDRESKVAALKKELDNGDASFKHPLFLHFMLEKILGHYMVYRTDPHGIEFIAYLLSHDELKKLYKEFPAGLDEPLGVGFKGLRRLDLVRHNRKLLQLFIDLNDGEAISKTSVLDDAVYWSDVEAVRMILKKYKGNLEDIERMIEKTEDEVARLKVRLSYFEVIKHNIDLFEDRKLRVAEDPYAYYREETKYNSALKAYESDRDAQKTYAKLESMIDREKFYEAIQLMCSTTQDHQTMIAYKALRHLLGMDMVAAGSKKTITDDYRQLIRTLIQAGALKLRPKSQASIIPRIIHDGNRVVLDLLIECGHSVMIGQEFPLQEERHNGNAWWAWQRILESPIIMANMPPVEPYEHCDLGNEIMVATEKVDKYSTVLQMLLDKKNDFTPGQIKGEYKPDHKRIWAQVKSLELGSCGRIL